MDATLERLRKSGKKPFHERTLFCADDVPIATLRPLMLSLFQHIETHYPAAQLHRFDDWLQHDGRISERRPATVAELKTELSSVESLYRSRQGNDQVWTAIYPESEDFLLRYYLWDITEEACPIDQATGLFSFTGYGFDLFEVRKLWGRVPIGSLTSAAYFSLREC